MGWAWGSITISLFEAYWHPVFGLVLVHVIVETGVLWIISIKMPESAALASFNEYRSKFGSGLNGD